MASSGTQLRGVEIEKPNVEVQVMGVELEDELQELLEASVGEAQESAGVPS